MVSRGARLILGIWIILPQFWSLVQGEWAFYGVFAPSPANAASEYRYYSTPPAPAPIAQPSLNANDLRAMLQWRDANPFMASFTDTPCSWGNFDASLRSSISIITCRPTNTSPTTSELRVTSMNLNGIYGFNFTGNASSSMNWTGTADLSALTAISFLNTQFQGTLPAEWSGLQSLTSLTISNTTFGGQIPSEWFSSGSFPVLSNLNLRDNNFSGPLPEVGDGALSSLTTLTLSGNQLSGQLPESWGRLTNVSFLFLQQNQLSGSLPESWGANTSFGSLYQLNLSRNNFEGTLPVSWGSPLAFSRNDDTPGLPYYQALNSRAKPLTLWLERNSGLTGPIPSSWSDSGLKAASTVEFAYAAYPLLTLFVQPQTGICGSVPPYVVALSNNVVPLGQANPLQPANIVGRASLPPCQNNSSTLG